MNGIQQGIMEGGRNIGQAGGRLIESCGNGDPMHIVFAVLGILLWAALMTILVMGMIALVRYLKKPKKEAAEK
jgi:cytochrome c-type biogenesis protein CcmH/NrfF